MYHRTWQLQRCLQIVTSAGARYECQVLQHQVCCAAVTLMVSLCGECGFGTQHANLVELVEADLVNLIKQSSTP